jgi:hypothetical protein
MSSCARRCMKVSCVNARAAAVAIPVLMRTRTLRRRGASVLAVYRPDANSWAGGEKSPDARRYRANKKPKRDLRGFGRRPQIYRPIIDRSGQRLSLPRRNHDTAALTASDRHLSVKSCGSCSRPGIVSSSSPGSRPSPSGGCASLDPGCGRRGWAAVGNSGGVGPWLARRLSSRLLLRRGCLG